MGDGIVQSGAVPLKWELLTVDYGSVMATPPLEAIHPPISKESRQLQPSFEAKIASLYNLHTSFSSVTHFQVIIILRIE